MKKFLMAYILQIAIWLDQGANVLLSPISGTIGYADETLSARSWRTHRDGKPLGFLRYIIDALFYWQQWDMTHCRRAYEQEITRAGFPPEYRQL